MIRKWLGAILLPVVAIIFLIAMFLGSDDPEEVEKPAPTSAVRDYEEPAADPEAAVADEAEEWIDLTLPTEEDKAEAQRLAQAFVTVFHQTDPDNPLIYINDAKELVTPDFYDRYSEIPKRGTLEANKVTVTNTAALPVDLSAEEQVWTVETTSEQKPEIGSPDMVYDEYSVLLVKTSEGWRVDGVKLNER